MPYTTEPPGRSSDKAPYPAAADWTKVFDEPGGHSLWRRLPLDDDVAIADQSMRIANRPESCDDGLMLLDLAKPATMTGDPQGRQPFLYQVGTKAGGWILVTQKVVHTLMHHYGIRLAVTGLGIFDPAFLLQRLDHAIESEASLSFQEEDGGLIVERQEHVHPFGKQMIMEPQPSLRAVLLALPDPPDPDHES